MQPIPAAFVAQQKNPYGELHFYQGIAYVSFFEQQTKKMILKSFREKAGEFIQNTHQLGNHSIGSKVHEYGGGAFCFGDNCCFFVDANDQQIYSCKLHNLQSTQKLTNIAHKRFGDLLYCPRKKILFAVCENCEIQKSSLVAYHLPSGKITTLLAEKDCYSSICYDPTNSSSEKLTIAWLEWDFPNMPWDVCELWIGSLSEELELIKKQKLSAKNESVFQPSFDEQGNLFFVSDKNNWWNIYVWNGKNTKACFPMKAEFATVSWVLGLSSYGFLNSEQIACCYLQNAYWYFAILDWQKQKLNKIKKFTNIQNLKAQNQQAVFLASKSDEDLSFYHYYAPQNLLQKQKQTNLFVVTYPQSVYFTNSSGIKIQAFFYDAQNAKGLIIKPHGGPTAFSDAGLDWAVQYWTSRGFCYFDINYRGSSGFGRKFRQSLYAHWGEYDVQDILDAANWVATFYKKKLQTIVLKGNSAGAFTILCALSRSPKDFSSAICYYPVTEPHELFKNTHSFELGYLKNLIGENNFNKKFWNPRALQKPILFLQGAFDKVVPSEGVQKIVKKIQKTNSSCELQLFEKEGHGFRLSQNIEKALALEHNFIHKFINLEN